MGWTFTQFVCELVRLHLVCLLWQLAVNFWAKLVMFDLFYNNKGISGHKPLMLSPQILVTQLSASHSVDSR